MAGQIVGSAIDLPCPGCGHKNRKTVGWLRTHSRMTCGGCGREVTLQSSNFRQGMRKVDAELDRFRRSVARLGRRL